MPVVDSGELHLVEAQYRCSKLPEEYTGHTDESSVHPEIEFTIH